VVRKRYRGRGLTYPSPGPPEITWGELHVGARQVFEDAGFEQVSRPTVRRVVMRIDFDHEGDARRRTWPT
jgi:hypothetical protein